MNKKKSDFNGFFIATLRADLFDWTGSDDSNLVVQKIVIGLGENGPIGYENFSDDEFISSQLVFYVKIKSIEESRRYIWGVIASKVMRKTLHRPFSYSEIVAHANLDLMTKLTDYPSPAKQEAKIEAQRRIAETIVLRKNSRNQWWNH